MSLIMVAEASKLVKKSVPTLYRHIRDGRLSAQVDHDGTKKISISELQRCYGTVDTVDNHENEGVSHQESHESKERIVDLTRHIRNLEETITDLRTRLDKSENERGLVLRLMTDQRVDSDPPKKKKKSKNKGKKSKKKRA